MNAGEDNKTEEDDDKRLTIDQAIEIMFDRKEHGDHISCYSPDGLRFVHLRYYQAHPESDEHSKIVFKHSSEMKSNFARTEALSEIDEHMKLMFKRCPEMKPYYAKIRTWFADNDLEWKDVKIDGIRYMATILPLRRFLISDYVKSIQTNVFSLKDFNITGHGDISMAIMGFKNPILLFISVIILLASMGGFISYQFTKIFDLGPPSFQALHKTEILLFVLFSLLSLIHI